MANFELSNRPRPVWSGGPEAVCSICKFRNEGYPWYLVFNSVYSELNYDLPTGQHVAEGNIHLCSDHAIELKGVLDVVVPDKEAPQLKAALLKAEANRAKAERRAEAAEKALRAMQDWIAGDDAK